MFWPILYTVLTTILAFLSLLFSEIKPIIDFGWMMTFGLITSFIITFTLLPSLLNFTPADNISVKNIIQKPGDVSLFWESSQKSIVQKKSQTFLKTHNALVALNNKNFTSEKTTLGAIYIIRDPRNILSSLKNHYGFNRDAPKAQ